VYDVRVETVVQKIYCVIRNDDDHDDCVKNVQLWRLREPDKEVGPGRYGKRLWTSLRMICT